MFLLQLFLLFILITALGFTGFLIVLTYLFNPQTEDKYIKF